MDGPDEKEVYNQHIGGLESLLERSRRLTSGIDDHGVPPLQRNMDQLLGAANKLARSSAARSNGYSTGDTGLQQSEQNKAHRLLSKGGLDGDRLTRDLQTVDLRPSRAVAERLGDTDIDGFLSHQHDMIIVTAIEEGLRSTIGECQRSTVSRMEDDWDRSRNNLMQLLGVKKRERDAGGAGPGEGAGGG